MRKRVDTRLSHSHVFRGADEGVAVGVADELVAVGLFERRGPKDAPEYWVQFLYRDALDITQGTAED